MARLQEELQKERDLRIVLEARLKMLQDPIPVSFTSDEQVISVTSLLVFCFDFTILTCIPYLDKGRP